MLMTRLVKRALEGSHGPPVVLNSQAGSPPPIVVEAMLIRSSQLTAPHGFPTREGGVSVAPFDSLNLGSSTGDAPERVAENIRRLGTQGGFDVERLRTVSQVHGDRVVEAAGDTVAGAIPRSFTEADGIFTAREGETLGIRVADCIPLLIEDPVKRQVAAVHSGWKGTDAEIASRAVEQLIACGSRASDLRAVVGPHIRSCCYEVSDELADRFTAKFGAGVTVAKGARRHLDLAFALTASLRKSGVADSHVEVLPHCTSCDARFYSHRRDKGATGRHMAFITCRFP